MTTLFQLHRILSATKICVLTSSIHRGNNSAIQSQFEMTNNSARPHTNPENATKRGKIAVRSAIVQVENMNIPAILMAKTFKNV